MMSKIGKMEIISDTKSSRQIIPTRMLRHAPPENGDGPQSEQACCHWCKGVNGE